MMKDKPFRLQRVWEVAQARVQSQLGEWSRWASRARQAREQAASVARLCQEAAQRLVFHDEGPLTAGELAARWHQAEDLKRRWRSAEDRAVIFEREAGRRLAALLVARREEQAYERLHLRHRERLRQEWLRWEQAQLDEAAASRHGR